jgi:hypothetical protein
MPLTHFCVRALFASVAAHDIPPCSQQTRGHGIAGFQHRPRTQEVMQRDFTAAHRNFRFHFVSAFTIALLILVFCSKAANAQSECTPGSCVGSAITSGAAWDDTAGQLITAHGGQIVLVDGTYYWIGEVDTSGGEMAGINCYSSPDLATWTFVNDVLPVSTTIPDLEKSELVERPKILWNASTGLWVMWMHIYNSDSVGYATSPTVCGNYTYLGSSQPLGNPSYDIGSFQDTDGTAYLLSADYDLGIIVYQMASDYLSAVSIVDPKSTWGDYEGPAMFKANGYYFLIMSHETGWTANDDQYSYATSIGGPWSTPVDIATPNTLTYNSQSTYVLPVTGTNGTTYMYMGDRWTSNDITTSPYVWLPLIITGNQLSLPDYTEANNPTWYFDVPAGTWSAPPTPPTYSLSATAATVTAGNSTATSTVTESVAGGFDSPVTLTVSGLPPGVTAAFAPPSITGAGTSTLTFTAASNAPAGTSTVTVIGTPISGAVETTTLQLMVSANGPWTQLINANSGLCLTGITTEGGQLQQVTCSSSTLQNWEFSTEGSGFYISNENLPWVVDVSGQSTSNGGVVDNWVPNGGTNQEWTFTNEGNDLYVIKSVHKSTLCLDIAPGQLATNGGLIEQITCASPVPIHQEWKISAPVPLSMTITPTAPAAITYGADTVTLTATAKFVSGTIPASALVFEVNGGSQTPGTCTISGTTDTCSVTYSLADLAAGKYAVYVFYTGDTNYLAIFASTTLTVNKAASTTVVTGGTFPYDGTAHGATVSVSGAGGLSLTPAPTYSGSCTSAPVTVAQGSACTVSYTYAGDNNHNGSSGSALVSITPDAALSLQVSNTQLVYPGAANTTVCVSPPTHVAAAGSVQIVDGSNVLVTENLQGNGCAYWYISPGLAAGTHTLVAFYSGDINNHPEESATVAVTVNPVPVNLSASCWNSSFPYGANYQCTANASSNAGAVRGVLSATYDGSPLNAIPLSGGNAQLSLPLPVVGNHTLAISYAPQGNFAGAGPQTSNFTVTPAPVNIALSPSSWYSPVGSSLTFSVTISSWSAGPPNATGSVSFYDGSTLLATVPVKSNGGASYTINTLSVGSQTIKATYSGGTDYASGSNSVSITLAP